MTAKRFLVFSWLILAIAGIFPGPSESHVLPILQPVLKPLVEPLKNLTTTLTNSLAEILSLTDAILYLFRFGYIKDLSDFGDILKPATNLNNIITGQLQNKIFKVAIKKFQKYAKLPITGEFDEQTRQKMNSPRCGNKDQQNGVNVRIKRHVLTGVKWEKKFIRYAITKYSQTGFPQHVIEKEIGEALDIWSDHCGLTFVRTYSLEDIDMEIRFEERDHGDVDPFDGRGIVLAHAFPPGLDIGGDVHFDDEEEWTTKEYYGTNFLQTAVHEIGHALGLDHSENENAMMYAFTQGYDPHIKLHSDDIAGIQAIYGPKSSRFVEEDLEKKSTVRKYKLCEVHKIDAITVVENEDIYAFRGNMAYLLDNDGGAGIKSSIKINELFPYLEGPLDAALNHGGFTYFFKGGYYWQYLGRKLNGPFPKKISLNFYNLPFPVDAAMTWSVDGETYFFKGDSYFRYNWTEKSVSISYPRAVSNWFGIPENGIDAALQTSGGRTYFFKDDGYYAFDNEHFQVEEVQPPYPRSLKADWFGCNIFSNYDNKWPVVNATRDPNEPENNNKHDFNENGQNKQRYKTKRPNPYHGLLSRGLKKLTTGLVSLLLD